MCHSEARSAEDPTRRTICPACRRGRPDDTQNDIRQQGERPHRVTSDNDKRCKTHIPESGILRFGRYRLPHGENKRQRRPGVKRAAKCKVTCL